MTQQRGTGGPIRKTLEDLIVALYCIAVGVGLFGYWPIRYLEMASGHHFYVLRWIQ